jgi:translation initiation factor IF-1
MSDKKKGIELDGVVQETLPNATFRVEIKYGEQSLLLLARAAGRMQKNYIRILTGDRVKIELTPPDITKGRIIYRYR